MQLVSVLFVHIIQSKKFVFAGFLLSVVIAGTINTNAGTTYHAQPVAE